MKSILFTGLFIFSFLVQSYSQTDFGVKAGINLSTIENYFPYGGNSAKIKAGFNTGLFARFTINPQFLFQPEFMYSQKGSKFSSLASGETIKLNYLSVPLLLGYMPNKKFTVLAGPELNFLCRNNTIFKKFDLTVNLGFSYKINKLGFDIRYNHGFNNLMEAEALDLAGNPTGQQVTYGSNRVIQIGVSYTLSKNK